MKNYFMFKIFIFMLLLLVLLMGVFNNSTYSFYNIFNNNEVASFCYIYDDSTQTNINNSLNSKNVKCIKNGSKWLVSFKNKSDVQNINKPQYMQVMGNFTAKTLKNAIKKINAKFVMEQGYNASKILFFYTPIWQEFRVLNNKKVNLQIVISNTITTIGYPMIYGSF